MSNGKMGFARLFNAENPRVEDAEKDAWSAKIEAMTDAEFFSTPAHVVALDRPLMKKPVAEYVSSRDMLHILWRNSEWKPDPDFDYGLDYAISSDREMLGFMNWVDVLLKTGRLQTYAQAEGGEYRDAQLIDYSDANIHGALLKGNRIGCEVRAPINEENTWQRNILPMQPAHCALWFRKCDVDELPCDETAIGHDLETVIQLNAQAPIAAAIEAYGRRGLEVATTRPDPIAVEAEAIVTAEPTAVSGKEKLKPGNKSTNGGILDLIGSVINGEHGGAPKNYPDFCKKLLAAHDRKMTYRALQTPPYEQIRHAYDKWAQEGGHKKREKKVNGQLVQVA